MTTTAVTVTFTLNGTATEVTVPPDRPFVKVLREDLGLTGTKVGCGEGECGTCTILLDDEPVCSCLLLPVHVEGRRVETVEGLEEPDGTLSRLQRAFMDEGAIQCGFCTPGMLMAAEALLRRNPHPTRDEVTRALAGNLCRCTGYDKIFRAVETAAGGEER